MDMDRRRISRVKIQRLQQLLHHPGAPHGTAGGSGASAHTNAEQHHMATHTAKEPRAK